MRLQSYNSDDRPIDPNVSFVGQRSNKNNGRNFNRNQQFNSRGRGFTPSGQTGVNSNSQKNLQRQQNYQVPHQQPQHRPPQPSPQQAPPQQVLRNTSRDQGSGNRFADTVCQICGRFGHTALRCWNRFDYSYQSQDIPQALAAMSLSDSQDPNWYTDTGASAHMTADAGNLKNITPGPIRYMLGMVLVYVFLILVMLL